MAKKKAKKRTRPEGYDPNEKRRERLEARREAKAQALAAQRARQRRERIVRYVFMAALFVGLIWFLFLRGELPSEINGHPVQEFSIQGAGEHTGPFAYSESPPVSGPHDAAVACGVYSEPIPDQNQVHNLEHGAVGIQYQPTLDPEQIRTIESIVRDFDSHVFSAPYEGMEPLIAVSAWGYRMDLDEMDEPAIRDFLDAFREGGDAPEAFQPCPNDQDAPFEGATPTPSIPVDPSASPSPEANGGGNGDGGNGGGGSGGNDGGGGGGNGGDGGGNDGGGGN